ncbi:MAG: hypothetical protein HY840_15655 [Bacteroidetes bacterium]|nr:hypothetical protein [Bacteroidota bacterium]
MNEEHSNVEHNGRTYSISLDKVGYVWFEDEKGVPTNYGQGRARSIEDAEKVAKSMLKASGR